MIVVVGVPGVGKTLLGVKIAKKLERSFTTISWIVLEKGLWRSYDWETRSFVVDENRLAEELRRYYKSVVETHWLKPFYTVGDMVEQIVFVRCNPLVLLKRLLRREWPLEKIKENVEAELLGVLVEEVLGMESRYNIPVVEVVGEGSLEELVREVLSGRRKCCIDWISVLGEDEQDKLFSTLLSLQRK